MKTRTMTKTNATTSLLGFGCMRFPINADGTINEAESFKMLDLAYDRGVNYYDTAYFYHDYTSEIVLGKWIKTKNRDSLYLATKSPVHLVESVDDFDRFFNEQLQKLQVEYFDYYLLHAMNKDKFKKAVDLDLFSRLDDLKAKGLIKRVGFSFHDDYAAFEEIINHYDWDFCQIQFNYMDTDVQAGTKGYELAKSKNIPVCVMEPVKGGQLANVPVEIKEVFHAAHPDWSDASWALRFVASHDNVYAVLSGMSTYDQVIDNLNTFDTFEMFTEEEYNVVSKAKALFDARVQVPCTGCRYCMPCPFGVNIPRNFSILNTAHIYNQIENGKNTYKNMKEGQASLCQKCGLCVTQCPQHIQIPDALEKMDKDFQ